MKGIKNFKLFYRVIRRRYVLHLIKHSVLEHFEDETEVSRRFEVTSSDFGRMGGATAKLNCQKIVFEEGFLF